MNITLRGLSWIAVRVFFWLTNVKKIVNNGTCVGSITAELYHNDRWAIYIEVRQLIATPHKTPHVRET